jgi:DNA-binding CsgD family transcriptional regulator
VEWRRWRLRGVTDAPFLSEYRSSVTGSYVPSLATLSSPCSLAREFHKLRPSLVAGACRSETLQDETTMDELQRLSQEVAKLQAERNLFERLYFEERQRSAHLQKLRIQQQEQPEAREIDTLLSVLCRLTLKQRASILALMAGYSYSDVALALGVSPATIKLHCRSAFDALGCQGVVHFKSQRPRYVRQLSTVNLEDLCGVPLDWMTTRPMSLISQLVKMRSSVPPVGGRHNSRAKTSVQRVD